MKKLMIVGSIVGFVSGVVLGTLQGASGTVVFWRASIAAVVCGYLFRWWGRVWLRAWQASTLERQGLHSSAMKGAKP